MPERMTFADGSIAERPGPLTYWRVRRGPQPHRWRFPPPIAVAVVPPGPAPESLAAQFCRQQNHHYCQFIREGGHALNPTL